MSEKKKSEAKRVKLQKIGIKIIILLALIAAIVASLYYYLQYQDAQRKLNNPTIAASEETRALIQKVSEIIELPKGENPEVATVSDKNQLPDEPFFANAEDGDKVLIYQQAGKAFLYRPSKNKIIEVSTVSNMAAPQATNSASASAVSPTPKIIKIAVYNGTLTNGLAASYAARLTAAISDIEIVSKLDAANSYDVNLVIDISGENAQIATQIASVIGGEIGVIPEGETKPNADILVIVGK